MYCGREVLLGCDRGAIGGWETNVTDNEASFDPNQGLLNEAIPLSSLIP